jgi:hypothetical protein
MESFYPIVISIAVVLLILLLTFMGILLRSQNSTEIFPPQLNSCPDYWTTDSSGHCSMPTQPSFANPSMILNMGGLTTLGSSATIAPYSTDGKSFDTTNPLWSSGGQSTICAQKAWAVNNGIVWDGVSQYNQC